MPGPGPSSHSPPPASGTSVTVPSPVLESVLPPSHCPCGLAKFSQHNLPLLRTHIGIRGLCNFLHGRVVWECLMAHSQIPDQCKGIALAQECLKISPRVSLRPHKDSTQSIFPMLVAAIMKPQGKQTKESSITALPLQNAVCTLVARLHKCWEVG